LGRRGKSDVCVLTLHTEADWNEVVGAEVSTVQFDLPILDHYVGKSLAERDDLDVGARAVLSACPAHGVVAKAGLLRFCAQHFTLVPAGKRDRPSRQAEPGVLGLGLAGLDVLERCPAVVELTRPENRTRCPLQRGLGCVVALDKPEVLVPAFEFQRAGNDLRRGW
jgi:hypothetical protein